MRDIEFRVWAYDKYISLSQAIETGDAVIQHDNSECFGIEAGYEYNVIEGYTGIKDKNGKEIYEGDKIKDIFYKSINGIVKYGEYKDLSTDKFGGNIGFYVDWEQKTFRKDLVYWAENSEVIGNIHEEAK